MKRARIFHQGRDIWATAAGDGSFLTLAHGEVIPAASAQWLPPLTPGASVYALGLNYADHNKELGFSPKMQSPLIFQKGGNAFVGHNGNTLRPPDADQMHPECELVVVIGKPARKVKEAKALDCVMGYSIANDYAIREYLENYFRPNARVKNRDGATALGPWIVDAADISNPQALRIETRVNGKLVQEGNTADMIISVAGLIEYLSSFLTLMPGDLILTGTPQGVHFCNPGDLVICEIEGIGALVNNLVSV
ncbi:MAG: fumarylacetoacetate hydrolase family protein [Parvularculaceae bacterium]